MYLVGSFNLYSLMFGILSITYLVRYFIEGRREKAKGIRTQRITFNRVMLLILSLVIFIVVIIIETKMMKIFNVNSRYVGLIGGITGIIYVFIIIRLYK